MDAKSKPIELVPVSERASEAAEQMVNYYAGDQVERPVVDVCGLFVVPYGTEKGPLLLTENLRGAVAKEIERHTAPLVAALKFYADEFTYEQVDVLGQCPLSSDKDVDGYGKRARSALGV